MKAMGRRGGGVSFQNTVLRGLAPALLLGLSPAALLANPTGGTVVAGSATIATSGNTLNVNTGSNQTIIDWGHFGIDAGEITNINQPNSSSTTLNRVIGGDLSGIYGTLNSNGNVILINPNGVLIGAGGIVNTQGSFTASTLDLSNSDFLAGNMHFTGTSTASVVNLGKITSQNSDIFLIAQHVSNSGSLTATNGTVGLAAGTDVTIQASGTGNQHLSVALDSSTVARNGTGVDNQGTIDAVKAELVANGNIYSLAVNNGGIIRAAGAGTVGGQVWLLGHGGTVKNTGTIIAKDADGQGGAIETSGDTVSIAGVVRTGKGGSWLIDPVDLDIDASLASAAATALENGTNVTEQATNSITLDSAIAWSGTNGGLLTLDAGTGTITLNAGITTGASGGLALRYGNVDIEAIATGSAPSQLTFTPVTIPLGGLILHNGATINLATSSSLTVNGNAYTLVGTLDDLVAAANAHDPYIALANNVAATRTYTSDPIGVYTNGVLEGLGHTISGLTVTVTGDNAAFIGNASGSAILHLNLADASVTAVGGSAGGFSVVNGRFYQCSISGSVSASGSWVPTGPIVGGGVVAGGISAQNTDWIDSCSSSATVSATDIGAGSLVYVGGLVGNLLAGVSRSTATGNVTVSVANSGIGITRVGGLAGFVEQAGQIDTSSASGEVICLGSGASQVFVGGLVGDVSYGPIYRSYATGNVSGGDYAKVGGLAGHMSYEDHSNVDSAPSGIDYDYVYQSYATGNVSGGDYAAVGGLIGSFTISGSNGTPWGTIQTSYATGNVSGGANAYVGGLVGLNGGWVFDSYATGRVSGGAGARVGGLEGGDWGGTVRDSYWNATNAGATGIGEILLDAGVTVPPSPAGLTSDQLNRTSSYSAGFAAAWQMADGVVDPYLPWQTLVTGTASGSVGALSATVGGQPVPLAVNQTGNGSYALVLNRTVAAGDTVTVTGTNSDPLAWIAAGTGWLQAPSALVVRDTPVVSLPLPVANASGPSVVLADGQTVTLPTSAFSPSPQVFTAPGSDSQEATSFYGTPQGNVMPGVPASTFQIQSLPWDGTGGDLASSSGVAYTDQ